MELQLPDVAATEQLGASLARTAPWLLPQPLTVFLQGELGAGKTTLARGLLRALGVSGTVRSPSYTLLESYAPPGRRILHLDLYRLNGAAELESLGIRDEHDPGVLLLVEWPERAERGLPVPDLAVALRHSAEHRRARIEAATEAGRAWLECLRADPTFQNQSEFIALEH